MKVISTIIAASLLIGSVAGILGGKPISSDNAYDNRSLQRKSYTAGIRKSIKTGDEDNFSFCSGALISPSHVLTTMTCVSQGNAKFVSVGAIYISDNDDGDEIQVVNVIKHSQFNKVTLSNNFAVLKLARNVKASIKPVKLPTSSNSGIQIGKLGTAMGWGLTSANGMGSEVLLGVNQTLISNDDCRAKLKSTTIDTTHVCAGGEPGKSPCDGDTGGPLIYQSSLRDSDDILIGLVSGRIETGCGTKHPAIYSRVPSVLQWIITAMKA